MNDKIGKIEFRPLPLPTFLERECINRPDITTDEGLDKLLAEKCKPILTNIGVMKIVTEKSHITPKRLILSPNAFHALIYALKNYYTFSVDWEKLEDGGKYEGMEVIVNHNLKDYDFQILGTLKEELNHVSQFQPKEEVT